MQLKFISSKTGIFDGVAVLLSTTTPRLGDPLELNRPLTPTIPDDPPGLHTA